MTGSNQLVNNLLRQACWLTALQADAGTESGQIIVSGARHSFVRHTIDMLIQVQAYSLDPVSRAISTVRLKAVAATGSVRRLNSPSLLGKPH